MHESTGGIILEISITHMEVHDLARLVPVPLCSSVKNVKGPVLKIEFVPPNSIVSAAKLPPIIEKEKLFFRQRNLFT